MEFSRGVQKKKKKKRTASLRAKAKVYVTGEDTGAITGRGGGGGGEIARSAIICRLWSVCP